MKNGGHSDAIWSCEIIVKLVQRLASEVVNEINDINSASGR